MISDFPFQEEVVLKRCWLARYWGLATRYGNFVERISDDGKKKKKKKKNHNATS